MPARGDAAPPPLTPVVLVPWLPPRRSSPQEDYIFTMAGLSNLLLQQRQLLAEMQGILGSSEKGEAMELQDQCWSGGQLHH